MSHEFSSINFSCRQKLEILNKINYDGNVIPLQWFKHITNEKGKPNLTAIMILSEIVYWCRPKLVRDEISGKVLGLQKKFKADLLQKSYKDLSEQFGFSKRQTSDAIKKLEDLKLIKRVLRNINGSPNVLYIDIDPINIENITKINENSQTEKCDISHEKENNILRKKERYLTKKSDTYTKITTEITTKNSLSYKTEKFNYENFDQLIDVWEKRTSNFIKNKFIPIKEKRNVLKSFKDNFDSDFKKWDVYCKDITSSKFLMGEIKEFKLGFLDAFKEHYISKIFMGEYNLGDRAPNLTESEKIEQKKQNIKKKVSSNVKNIESYLFEFMEKEKLDQTTQIQICSAEYLLNSEQGSLLIKPLKVHMSLFRSLKDSILRVFQQHIPSVQTVKLSY